MSQKSRLEETFYRVWRDGRLSEAWPMPERQWKFLEDRDFAFDFAWPQEDVKVAIEIQGGQWSNGRHNRGTGMQQDCEKRNLATKAGWKVYYLTTSDMAKCRQGELIWKVTDWLTVDHASTETPPTGSTASTPKTAGLKPTARPAKSRTTRAMSTKS